MFLPACFGKSPVCERLLAAVWRKIVNFAHMISKSRIKFVRSLNLKKIRRAEDVFVAEGPKLVEELMGRYECVYMAATERYLAERTALGMGAAMLVPSVDSVTDEELRRISFQEAPQDVLAVFRQRHAEVSMTEVASSNLCLALDEVQNPGNLGTILRIADWFGIEHVFCSGGCADVYGPKTVQATMGALARVNVHYVDLAAQLHALQSSTAAAANGIPVYGTFLDGDDIYQKRLSQRGLIVMGNEGKGISPLLVPYVTEKLFVPNFPKSRETTESLNVAVATAVVCAEFRRQCS